MLALISSVVAATAEAANLSFRHVVIDSNNPANPHNKTLGDIDGDGFLDAIVASSSGDGMFWYEYPAWTKHAIRSAGSWTTDMQAADLDEDGDLDVITPTNSALVWYENPRSGGDPRTDTWTQHTIGAAGGGNHDVEIADVDGDGDMDVVSRKKRGEGTFFWRQQTPTSWTQITVSTRAGEGTGLGDLDGDGDIDVVHNGFWMEQITPTNWVERDIDTGGPRDSGARIADVNGNGRNDVVLSPSETSSGRFSWYEAADPRNGPWTEHVIDSTVSYLHTFQVLDVDGDGDLDFVTAEMHQSADPDEVSIYFNLSQGLSWSQQVVATTGSHNVRAGDIGNDGDIDIFGANWNDRAPNSAVVEYWENLTDPVLPLDQWETHLIDGAAPWQPVLSDTADVDGDGRVDIVAGGFWYKNPGSPAGAWTRNTISDPFNMAWVRDFDGDGDADILGTRARLSGADFVWARNNGSGAFTVLDNVQNGEGDFLQGVAGASFSAGGPFEIALSWHAGGKGVQMITVPSDPVNGTWTWRKISNTSQDEALSVGDLDGDGNLDLYQGTRWLRYEGESWTEFTANGVSGDPDRNRLADIDGDGDLDAVVGFEGTSTDLIWLEHPTNATATWRLHTIATGVGGGYSMDVADMDGDGDTDVILGEHKGAAQTLIFENGGNGGSWTPHGVGEGGSGIDHHDGSHPVDIDGDGDLDIISIGWFNDKVWLFENKAINGGASNAS